MPFRLVEVKVQIDPTHHDQPDRGQWQVKVAPQEPPFHDEELADIPYVTDLVAVDVVNLPARLQVLESERALVVPQQRFRDSVASPVARRAIRHESAVYMARSCDGSGRPAVWITDPPLR